MSNIREDINRCFINTINEQRVNDGKEMLSPEQEAQVIGELEEQPLILTKMFDTTSIPEEEYKQHVEVAVRDNVSQPGIIDIIRRAIGI